MATVLRWPCHTVLSSRFASSHGQSKPLSAPGPRTGQVLARNKLGRASSKRRAMCKAQRRGMNHFSWSTCRMSGPPNLWTRRPHHTSEGRVPHSSLLAHRSCRTPPHATLCANASKYHPRVPGEVVDSVPPSWLGACGNSYTVIDSGNPPGPGMCVATCLLLKQMVARAKCARI